MKRFVPAMVFVALTAVSIAGCSSGSTVTLPSVEIDTTAPSTEPVDLRYRTVDGAMVDLTRGPTARPLALWFWAPG